MNVLRPIYFWIATLIFVIAAPAGFSQAELNFGPLDSIPVQDNGRMKPLQTFSGETVKDITGRWKFQGRQPVNSLLLFLSSHDWSDADIVKLGYIPLKEELGLDVDKTRFSVNELVNNQKFQTMADAVRQKQMADKKLSKMDNEVGQLMHQLISYQILVSGESLAIVPPPPGSPEGAKWLSIVQPTGYPAETQTKIKDTLSNVISAFHH
ncbi:hypothetical protein K8I31_00665, partial [bacterium]|nr:hypothetical protein [bacterium]